MLAINNRIDVTSAPQAANDRLAAQGVVAAMPLDAANDDAAHDETAHDETALATASAPSSEPSWLLDWARVWSNAASSMIDASAASLEAISTVSAASATRNEPEPAKLEVSLWSQPPRSAQPRSWYRPPQPNLLDPTAWGFPAPLAVYGVPVTPQMAMGFNQMQPWSAMAQAMQPAAMSGWPGFGNAFGTNYGSAFPLPFCQQSPFANPFARQPENPMTAWMSSFAPQPANPWASVTKAMTAALTPVPYSSYRSDSGHAVAQIARPEPKASSAQEAAMAFLNLFAWPSAPTQ